MWEVGILFSTLFKHGLAASVYLTKFNLIAHITFLSSCPWDKLPVDPDDIALMLLHAVGDHVFNKSIKGLNLLIYDTILCEVGIDNRPLISFADLVVL